MGSDNMNSINILIDKMEFSVECQIQYIEPLEHTEVFIVGTKILLCCSTK